MSNKITPLTIDLRWLGSDLSLQKIKSALANLSAGQTLIVTIHSYLWPDIEDLIRREGLIVTKRECQKMNTELIVSLVWKS